MTKNVRSSFIFYRSFFEAISCLDNDKKASVYDAICDFALNQTVTILDPIPKAIFTLIMPQIEANNKRFNNGKKGGRPKEVKPKRNQKETKVEPNANDNVFNVNEELELKNKEKIYKKESRFTPPTTQNIHDYMNEYCNSKNIDVDLLEEPEKLYDFYQSKNWFVGKNKMKDWKAAIRNWFRSGFNQNNKPKERTLQDDYDRFNPNG